MAKVSIGMPVYNGAVYIREALDSLLVQSFENFELIISDNASTDDTQSICEEYVRSDPRIRYVRQKKNLGAAKNFHYVLDLAKSDYFMWAAADDYWMPTFIEECLILLRDNKNIQFVVTDFSVRSRSFCFLNLENQSIFGCVEKTDAKDRVLSYTRLPFTTHKDNLVYAMWRRSLIKNVTIHLDEICGQTFIGGAINEYILSMCKGGYIQKILFLKKYKGIPPGHRLGRFLSWLKKLFVNKKDVRQCYDQEVHISLLKQVLKSANFSTDFINEVIMLNQYHIKYGEEKTDK